MSDPGRGRDRPTIEAAALLPALPVAAGAATAGVLLGAALGGGWPWTAALGAAVAVAVWTWAPTLDRGWPLALALAAAVLAAAAGHARLEAARDAPPHPLAAQAAAEAAAAAASATGPATGPAAGAAAAADPTTHTLTGVVRDTPQRRGTLVTFDLDLRTLDGVPGRGGVRVVLAAAEAAPAAGDLLRLVGTLEPPPELETFDYAAFLGRRGIYAESPFPERWEIVAHDADGTVRSALRGVREAATDRIDRAFPEPEASIAAGMLLGARRSLPPAVEADLRASGTAHLVVVSGQNIAMVLGAAVAVLGAWISRRRAALVALGLLPGYVLLVGADPPVVRAALMAVGVVVAAAAGRRTPGWVMLAYAAAGMLLVDPGLAFDPAFQLSLAATAGILVLAEPLTALGARAAATGARAAAWEVGAISTAAALAVAPVQAAQFGTLAPWQIPANIVVAPLYEATLLAALAAAALGGGPGAEVVGPLGAPAPAAFRAVAGWFAALPGGTWTVPAPTPAALGWWAALGAGAWLLGRRTPRPEAAALPGLSGAAGRPAAWLLGVAAVALWGAALTPAPTYATVTVLDVGQGLAVLVEDRGAAVLIDTGPPDGAVVDALGRAGVRRLDAVVLTHDDLDHRGGLAELVRRGHAATVLDGAGTAGHRFDIGDRLRLGERTTIEVLAPPLEATRGGPRAPGADDAAANDRSLVLRITVGDRRLLVGGDIEAAGEAWLVRSGADLRADVLVVPHHGSATSSGAPLLAAVAPRVAVISVGRNAYGHPHPDVLARLTAPQVAAEVRRTDRDGDIAVHSDGRRLWLEERREGG